MRVIEGAITEIKVDGDKADKFGVRRLLNDLVRERPSKLASIERKLLIINDTPGVRIVDTAVEEIGETTGNFRLIVKVQTWRNYATIGLDNSGTPRRRSVASLLIRLWKFLLFAGRYIGVKRRNRSRRDT